jgi:hypothetical protein
MGFLWPIPLHWRIVWALKVIVIGYAMISLFTNPASYLENNWDIHVDQTTMQKIYAVCYQFAITGSCTFVLFFILLLFAKVVPGCDVERLRLLCFFLGASCFIDIFAIISTITIYWKDNLPSNFTNTMTVILDFAWLTIEWYFIYHYYPWGVVNTSKKKQ